MKVTIGNKIYRVFIVPHNNVNLHGEWGNCNYENKEIHIIDIQHLKLDVLIHELTHAYMEEYLLEPQAMFTHEDVATFMEKYAQIIVNKAKEV